MPPAKTRQTRPGRTASTICLRFRSLRGAGPKPWRQLLADETQAELGARAFDLLSALIEHRDRVATEDKLLWRSTSIDHVFIGIRSADLHGQLPLTPVP
jgi:DNA-binding response OmpR family regulator